MYFFKYINDEKNFFGKTPAEYPLTSRDYYRKIYFETADLLVGHIEDRFQQPSFQIYQRLESLLLDSLSKDIQCLDEDIAYVEVFTTKSTHRAYQRSWNCFEQ